MYSRRVINELLAVFHAGESADRITMKTWVQVSVRLTDGGWSHYCSDDIDTPAGTYLQTAPHSYCRTAGCLVGTYILSLPKNHPWKRSKQSYTEIARDITESCYLSDFLFMCHRHLLKRKGSTSACYLSGPEALNRLRKTIAYLNRKQSLWEVNSDQLRQAAPGTEHDSTVPYRDRCNWNFAARHVAGRFLLPSQEKCHGK